MKCDKITYMSTSKRRSAALRYLLGVADPPYGQEVTRDTGSSDNADATTSYLVGLLKDTRDELTHADSKAALLLAATGVIVSALFAGMLGGRWTPFQLDIRVQWTWWLGVGLAASGIFSIAAVVYPRIYRHETSHPGVPAYYGDVAAFKDIDAFRQAVEKVPSAQKRLTDQIFYVSQIVQRKYLLLRRGMRLLFFAFWACTAAVLINWPLTR
jgi:hypothetical protein